MAPERGPGEEGPAPLAVFRRRRRVVERDLDDLDHVNNVVWLRFVMELAGAHSEAVGLDLETLRGLGGVWVVQRHELDYHRPAGLGEEILEETWIARMGGARSVRHARLSSLCEGTAFLSVRTSWAFVDPVTGRPRRLPRTVLERFVSLEEPPPLPEATS
ncbi:MAG: thioesterase family protein [Myxococcota bacterium]